MHVFSSFAFVCLSQSLTFDTAVIHRMEKQMRLGQKMSSRILVSIDDFCWKCSVRFCPEMPFCEYLFEKGGQLANLPGCYYGFNF